MEVLQLMINAYRSFFMMYGWLFDRESRGNLDEMQVSKLWFFTSVVMELFLGEFLDHEF
jgi:hypothetical protein